MRATSSQKGASSGVASATRQRACDQALAGVVAQAGEAQVVVVAATEEAVGKRAENPPGAGLLASAAAEVAVEHGGALGRHEPTTGVGREDVGGDDVRVHGPGSRAGLHTQGE